MVACVFDTSDRAIERMYCDLDRLAGRTLEHAQKDTAIFILSRRGFNPSGGFGVLLSNLKLDAEDPGMEDMAPTALRLFGIEPPEWMEGKSVMWGRLAISGRLLTGLGYTLRPTSGGYQPPRRLPTCPTSGALVGSLVAAFLAGCGGNHSRANGKQVIVIGVDGMDPGFVERHWADLPNLSRMRERGSFTRLATTTPPQSPTAWSTFITGLDPAEHGIFDFVHRDPATMQPFLSMAETTKPNDARLSDSARPLAIAALAIASCIAA